MDRPQACQRTTGATSDIRDNCTTGISRRIAWRSWTVAWILTGSCLFWSTTGCTAIGIGVDHLINAPDTTRFELRSPHDLGVDTILVYLKAGPLIKGTYLGLRSAPFDEFKKEYEEWQDSSVSFHPRLGDTITVRTVTRRVTGALDGFSYSSVQLRVLEIDQMTRIESVSKTRIEIDDVRQVYDMRGVKIEGDAFRTALSTGTIPSMTRLLVGVPPDTVVIPLHAVSGMYEVGIQHIGTIIGGVMDVATVVLAVILLSDSQDSDVEYPQPPLLDIHW